MSKLIKVFIAGVVTLLTLTANGATTAPEVPQPLQSEDPILLKLSQCESGGNPNAINPSDGGSPSFGLFQWKTSSLWYYNEKYKLVPDLERKEVENVIMDPYVQIEMTKVVLKEPNGWMNWKNCFNAIRGRERK